jgi:hypothetical protein
VSRDIWPTIDTGGDDPIPSGSIPIYHPDTLPTGVAMQERIDHHLAEDALRPVPEPDLLVAWLAASQCTDVGSDDDREIAMARIVRAAERGGNAHMEAVADWIGKLPPPPPDPKSPRYEMKDGVYRPAFHENSILIELRVTIDGQVFVAREALDPWLFDRRFGDPAEFERFLEYFIRSSLGKVVSTPEALAHFRKKLWIVRADDEHSMQICAESDRPQRDRSLFAVCQSGLILRDSLSFDGGVEPVGTCPCRCHERDGTKTQARIWAGMHNLPQFDPDKAS